MRRPPASRPSLWVKLVCRPALVATVFGAVFGTALLNIQPEAFESEPSYPEHAPRAAVFEPSVTPAAFTPATADSLPSFTETITSGNASTPLPLEGVPTLLPSE